MLVGSLPHAIVFHIYICHVVCKSLPHATHFSMWYAFWYVCHVICKRLPYDHKIKICAWGHTPLIGSPAAPHSTVGLM